MVQHWIQDSILKKNYLIPIVYKIDDYILFVVPYSDLQMKPSQLID